MFNGPISYLKFNNLSYVSVLCFNKSLLNNNELNSNDNGFIF